MFHECTSAVYLGCFTASLVAKRRRDTWSKIGSVTHAGERGARIKHVNCSSGPSSHEPTRCFASPDRGPDVTQVPDAHHAPSRRCRPRQLYINPALHASTAYGKATRILNSNLPNTCFVLEYQLVNISQRLDSFSNNSRSPLTVVELSRPTYFQSPAANITPNISIFGLACRDFIISDL